MHEKGKRKAFEKHVYNVNPFALLLKQCFQLNEKSYSNTRTLRP